MTLFAFFVRFKSIMKLDEKKCFNRISQRSRIQHNNIFELAAANATGCSSEFNYDQVSNTPQGSASSSSNSAMQADTDFADIRPTFQDVQINSQARM